MAVGGDDMLVHTFDAATGAALDVYAGDDRVASTGADGGALLWTPFPEWTWARTIGDPASSEIIDRVTALDFSPDGKLLASGIGLPSRSGKLKIWNPADGKLVREVADAHSDTVFCVRFSPDGKTLASGAADKFLKTFDVASGKLVRSFEGHTHHVLGVAWSADGRLLATGGADNAVKSWNVDTGEQKKTTAGFTKEVNGISFIGTTIEAIASSGDKTVRLLKADLGTLVKQFDGANGFLYCCAVSTDGRRVAAGGQDGILRVGDVATGTELKNFTPPDDSSARQAKK